MIQNLLEEIKEYLEDMHHTRVCEHDYCLCPSVCVSDKEPDQLIDKIKKYWSKSMQNKIKALVEYIESLNVHNLPHTEDCNYRHPMSMSFDCTCHCALWLELKDKLLECKDE